MAETTLMISDWNYVPPVSHLATLHRLLSLQRIVDILVDNLIPQTIQNPAPRHYGLGMVTRISSQFFEEKGQQIESISTDPVGMLCARKRDMWVSQEYYSGCLVGRYYTAR
jgi:hypothetical protein